MNSTIKHVIAALLTGGALIAPQAALAFPGDFRLSNEAPFTIKPWFRSPCWNPSVLNAGPSQWVDFGGIGPNGGAFTWGFGGNFIPECLRTAGFDFTYTVPAIGEPPPVGNPRNGRLVHVQFDPNATYFLQVGGLMGAFNMPGP